MAPAAYGSQPVNSTRRPHVPRWWRKRLRLQRQRQRPSPRRARERHFLVFPAN